MSRYLQTLCLFGSQIFQKACLFFIASRLASVGGMEEYGKFAYAKSYVNFLDTAISSSLFPVLIRDIQKSGLLKGVLVRSLFRSVCVFLFTMLMVYASLSLREFFKPADFVLLVVLSSNVFFFGFMHAAVVAKSNFTLLLLGSFVSFIFSILVIYFLDDDLDFYWALIVLCLIYIIEVGFRFYGVAKIIRSESSPSVDVQACGSGEANKSVGYYAFLASLANSIFFLIFRDILANSNSGLVRIGNLDIAFQLIGVSLMLISSLNVVQFAKVNSSQNATQLKKEFFKTLANQVAFSSFICLSVFLVSSMYYGFFFKDAKQQYLMSMLPVIPLYAIALCFNRIFLLLEKPSVLVAVSVLSGFGALVSVILVNFGENVGVFYSIYYLISVFIYCIAISKVTFDGSGF